VTIPESVTSIGRCAFYNCRDMADATILSKNITFGTSVFNENIALRIVSGSNAVAWAEANGYRYDICEISDTALTLKIGQTHTLIAYGYKNSQLTWSSSNKKVATVSSGKVRAVGEGKCTVSAKVSGGKTLKCKVTVVNPLTITVDGIDEETIYNQLWVYFKNNTNKKITYVLLDIAQYNNRGDLLESPYDYFYLNETVYAGDKLYHYYWVNDDTKKVKIRITEVTFSDGSRWRP